MRELVDKVHQHVWEFSEQCGIEIKDPTKLRRHIQRQVSSAMQVISPAEVERLGYKKIATMIDAADRYNITLGEMLREMLIDGIDRSASVAHTLYQRKNGQKRRSRRSHLRLVE